VTAVNFGPQITVRPFTSAGIRSVRDARRGVSGALGQRGRRACWTWVHPDPAGPRWRRRRGVSPVDGKARRWWDECDRRILLPAGAIGGSVAPAARWVSTPWGSTGNGRMPHWIC